MSKEILLVVESVSNEKGVGEEVIFEAMELALATAAKKRYPEEDLELKSSDFPNFPYFLMAWSKNVRRGIKAKARLYPKSN